MSVQRLVLGDDQWVDVKSALKVKATRQIHDHVKSGMDKGGEEWHFNPVRWAVANAAARIVAWKVNGAKPWPVEKSFTDRIDILEELDEAEFDAINKAIGEYVESLKPKETEKNETPAPGETA